MKSKNGERSDQGGEQSPTSTRHTTAPLHHQDEGEHNEESMPDASSQTSQRSGVETAADDDASMNSEIPSSRAIGMPNSMNSSQEPTAAAATSSSDESGNERNSLPQHEEDEVEVVDEVYESTRIFQRNKRLLISRLYETAPRGRLSMVRKRHVHVCWTTMNAPVTRFTLLIMGTLADSSSFFLLLLRRLISVDEASEWKKPSY